MPRILSRSSLLAGLLLHTGLSLADAPISSPDDDVDRDWTMNVYFDNDLFTNTDQQYTNGVRASWISPELDNFIDDDALAPWQQNMSRYLTLLDPTPENFGEVVSRRFVFSIGQQMFTPADRDRKTLDPDDRPYAGWLYAGFGYNTATRDKMNLLEVNLGMVGPASLAEQSQDFIHDLRGFEKFKGWDNQLHNEPGLQVVFERNQRLFRHRLSRHLSQDLIGHVGGSLGNVATYVNGGAEYRIGWNLPHDFGTARLRPAGDTSEPLPGDPRLHNEWGIHAFISLDGRWVMHDIFLDGNTFRDSPSVSKEPLVGEAAYGIAATYDHWKFSFAHVYESKQFRKQPGGHNYGAIAVSYTFD